MGKAFEVGEHKSTSIASMVLRKVIPRKAKVTHILGNKLGTMVAKQLGTKGLR